METDDAVMRGFQSITKSLSSRVFSSRLNLVSSFDIVLIEGQTNSAAQLKLFLDLRV